MKSSFDEVVDDSVELSEKTFGNMPWNQLMHNLRNSKVGSKKYLLVRLEGCLIDFP